MQSAHSTCALQTHSGPAHPATPRRAGTVGSSRTQNIWFGKKFLESEVWYQSLTSGLRTVPSLPMGSALVATPSQGRYFSQNCWKGNLCGILLCSRHVHVYYFTTITCDADTCHHCTEGVTEAQRGLATCSKSQQRSRSPDVSLCHNHLRAAITCAFSAASRVGSGLLRHPHPDFR